MSFGAWVEPLPITEESEILIFQDNQIYTDLFTLTISKDTNKIKVTATPATATPAVVPVGTVQKPTYIPGIYFTIKWLASLNTDLDPSTIVTNYSFIPSDKYSTTIDNVLYNFRVISTNATINATAGWTANSAQTLLTIEPTSTGYAGSTGDFTLTSLTNGYINPNEDSSLLFNVNPFISVFDYTNIINRKYKPTITGTATAVPLD